ncbi:PAS domain S-box protein [Thermospira aquatica]|uniref:histidine kinase n=1 Tax=Thermospira aquatica TaxID=2828656 RepID=A0AAX3BA96_9SPIR|nr:PAS domain S-box protein [Thermospira aquatica]URA09121.1 PAS domain S-box protein [Thermospira aquatica]
MILQTKPIRVLLVEDESILALAQKKELEHLGYEVLVATNPEEALRVGTSEKALDVILMDIDLGKGKKDGTEIASEILSKRDIPIVFLSSHTELEIVEKTESITSYGYVVKSSGCMVLDTSIKMALRLFQSKQQKKQKAEEHERLTRQLRINEDRLSKIMVAVNDGIWDWDLGTNQVYYSPRYYTMAGYEVNEFPFHPEEFFSRLYPEDAARVKEEVEKHLRGETDRFVLEFRFRRKDSSWMWILGRGYIVERDQQGKPLRFLGTHTDISERKRMEEALIESRNRYQAIVDQSFDGIALFSSTGSILQWNKKMAEITGFGLSEVEGKFIWEIMIQLAPPEIRSSELYHQLKDGFLELSTGKRTEWEGKPREQRIVRRDNSAREVQTLSFRVKSGQNVMICTIMRDITETKEAEKKQKESEDRFRLLAEASSLGILMYQDDQWIYVNPAAAHISGYTREEILQMRPWDIVCPEDQEMIKSWVMRREHGFSTPVSYEARILHRDGSVRWVLVSGVGVFYEGRPAGLISVVDITERKKIEEILKETLQEREALLNALPDLLFILDKEGRFLDVRVPDKDLQDLLYTKPENFLGRLVTEILPPEIAAQSFQAIKHTLETGEISLFSYTLMMSDEPRHYEARHSKLDENRVLAIVRDITEAKIMERKLQESEEMYRNIFQNSMVGLFHAQISDGRILECNDQFARIFGYEKQEDILGKLVLFENSRDTSTRHRMIEQINKTGEIRNEEATYERVDGSVFWARYSVRLYPEKGWIEGVFEDITEQKKAEEALRQQIEEKNIILREVHHRIKNNITSIMTLLRIQTDETTNEEAKAILQDAISRVESMRIMYDKLLQIPDASSLSVKAYLEDLLEAIMSIFPQRDRIVLRTDIPETFLQVKKLFPLGIIVNELVTNTAKYAFIGDGRGELSISIGVEDGTMTLIVEDNGVGMPPDKKEKGGFGLQLIQMLTNQLEGILKISSQKGTKVTVTFPLGNG